MLTLGRILVLLGARVLDKNSSADGKRASFVTIGSSVVPSELFLHALKYAATAWSVYQLSLSGNKAAFSAAALLLSLVAATSAIIGVAGIARVPIFGPDSSSSKKGWFSSVLVVPWVLLAVVVELVIHSGVIGTGSDKDVRIGGILAISMVGIRLLARRHSSEDKQQRELAAIRREIVLGIISTPEAHQRARVALQGLWLSDLVKQETGRLLALISGVTNEHESALFKMKALKTGVDLSAPELSDLDRLTFSIVMDAMVAHETRVSEMSREYFRLLNKVLVRLTAMARLAPGAESDKRSLAS